MTQAEEEKVQSQEVCGSYLLRKAVAAIARCEAGEMACSLPDFGVRARPLSSEPAKPGAVQNEEYQEYQEYFHFEASVTHSGATRLCFKEFSVYLQDADFAHHF